MPIYVKLVYAIHFTLVWYADEYKTQLPDMTRLVERLAGLLERNYVDATEKPPKNATTEIKDTLKNYAVSGGIPRDIPQRRRRTGAGRESAPTAEEFKIKLPAMTKLVKELAAAVQEIYAHEAGMTPRKSSKPRKRKWKTVNDPDVLGQLDFAHTYFD